MAANPPNFGNISKNYPSASDCPPWPTSGASTLMNASQTHNISGIGQTNVINSTNFQQGQSISAFTNMQNPNSTGIFPPKPPVPSFAQTSSYSTLDHGNSHSSLINQMSNVGTVANGFNNQPKFQVPPMPHGPLSVEPKIQPSFPSLNPSQAFCNMSSPSAQPNLPMGTTDMRNVGPPAVPKAFEVASHMIETKNNPVRHTFIADRKDYPQQAVDNYYRQNGNYPGGMGSMQQEFSKMDVGGAHQMRSLDLLQTRSLLSSGTGDNEIVLPPTVCNPEVHCSPSIFRCTLEAIPQTQELLKKSRLPFGLSLQPFRDMKEIISTYNHLLQNLNIIQTSTIVRCRYCRTYINPYIYLPDSRHWKCNICYRVNDLPDDFNWDPSTKTFGEPIRRPEIRYATVEFIATSEYMLRPPQPAVYLFILDISKNAIESGYLHTFTEQLLISLDQIPGDDRTMFGLIGVDSAVHFFQFIGKSLPRQLIVDEIDEIFLPANHGLLINLRKNPEVVRSFVQNLPALFSSNSSSSCCIGAALIAGKKLIEDIGGRISVFLTTIPNIGPGSLISREDPNQRASEEIQNLSPASDFYKRLALECTSHQIAVDLFLFNNQYVDLSTLSDMSKFSTGCIYHFPNYRMFSNQLQTKRFQKQLNRYLVRKIGFEAVLRIRCTKGLSLHTFYGNFFVRSTDLLAMANINPDSAIGAQVQMEEDLIGINTACFQAALLYTSSKGDRRIRVHTLCIPVTKDLYTVYNNFNLKCSVSLLSKMAVNRSLSGSSLADSREAMINAIVDAFDVYNTSVIQTNRSGSILSPTGDIRLFPLYILGMLKHSAFTYGQSIKLDNRVNALLLLRSAPVEVIALEIYPALYCLNHFEQHEDDPPRLHLTFEHIDRRFVYLMDTGSYVYIYVPAKVATNTLQSLFGVDLFTMIDEEKGLEPLDNALSESVHGFIRRLSITRSVFAPLATIREDGQLKNEFISRLIEDRTESSHSYIEFLNYIRQEIYK